ncbi:MAG: 2-polyprenylphenol 6-hydroxylase, partial [Candidatus Lightella neohaematopini]|nr:2-polyprenylphenol 6-hydroxylase [Candidatus Lightella neohaematopini]
MLIKNTKRLLLIFYTIIYYKLYEFIPKNKSIIFKFFTKVVFLLFKKSNINSLGKRLRLALQELGPIWIKFGQMLSTRYDIFPISIINQLTMLQNKVNPSNKLVTADYVKSIIGNNIDVWFSDFEYKPIASASIAQVHTACLKNGQEIIVKIIRPDILPIIKIDINLMYIIAKLIIIIIPSFKRFKLEDIISEYKRTILNELDLLKETSNAIKLRNNFKNSEILYIPKVYPKFCKKNFMVMERIYGVPINNIKKLKKCGINMKLLAEYGVQIFLTQVFRDSFFHGDMHPGNILVNITQPHKPKYISIDYGIVGYLNKKDKYYLAENLIAFFNHDYRKIAELHINYGLVSSKTNIDDLEFAIRYICEPCFKKPLSEISFSKILFNLFKITKKFNMTIQPRLVLLQKTMLSIENMGKQLYPQLDLWKTVKPFLENWLKSQVNIFNIISNIRKNIPNIMIYLPELPELLINNITN